jgi:hypothetical protein
VRSPLSVLRTQPPSGPELAHTKSTGKSRGRESTSDRSDLTLIYLNGKYKKMVIPGLMFPQGSLYNTQSPVTSHHETVGTRSLGCPGLSNMADIGIGITYCRFS